MKKLIFNLTLLVFISFASLLIILSTVGIKTNKFNNLISSKASQNNNISLKLEKIKFKLNLKELNLFLETNKPKIKYRGIYIPVKNLKIYIDFLSLLKSKPKIQKTNIDLEELDVDELNKLLVVIKPSNFRSLLKNKIKAGKLSSQLDLFLDNKGFLDNFIARGSIKNLKAELVNGLIFTQTNFNFFADKNDILIKNVFGNLADIKISDGDIKLNLEKGIKLSSNFNSNLNLNEEKFNKYEKLFKKYTFVKNLKNLKADLNNNISLEFDKTYKLKNYNYNFSGILEKGEFQLSNPIKNDFIKNEIKKIYLSNFEINTIFSPKNVDFSGIGKYSFDDLNFLNFNIKNKFKKKIINLKIDFEYKGDFELDLINFKKPKDAIAKLSLDIEKNIDDLKINNFEFKQGKNFLEINNLRLKGEKFVSIEKLKVLTSNNDFFVQNEKKIIVKGKKFDATNLAKFFNNQSNENNFQNLDGSIEIDFKKINVPMSETLENFKLLGEINQGQFIKITSKGDFGGNNFLDISMKKDKNTSKKYLEIYSDLTRPLLTEYSFFKGLTGGKLLFTSVIDGSNSISKLKIENFKVINAPGLIQLLSLADLRGLVDLAEGDGLSFDILEIDLEKNKNFLKINEILALGPSMSVLMEGYQDEKGLTSLRGSLIPAKTLNKMISKIPVIGEIVIPKEVGEGLFGISFKMKGPKGKIKTSINPIRTLTPRFLQKIIDRKKMSR
tara:strand:+ start:1105 stop:3276 length:2172 start_codon:yes stop_codon:yes gene_type:complete